MNSLGMWEQYIVHQMLLWTLYTFFVRPRYLFFQISCFVYDNAITFLVILIFWIVVVFPKDKFVGVNRVSFFKNSDIYINKMFTFEVLSQKLSSNYFSQDSLNWSIILKKVAHLNIALNSIIETSYIYIFAHFINENSLSGFVINVRSRHWRR